MKSFDAVIISGGHIDHDFATAWLKDQLTGSVDVQDDLIAADAGIIACRNMNIIPGHIVGDFDSTDDETLKYFQNIPGIDIHKYDPKKDWTDTEIALQLSFALHKKTIALLGATGSRIDHVLGNIQLLKMAQDMQMELVIIDACNRITLHDSPFVLKKDKQWGKYVSLFAFGADVHGLCLHGFAYDIDNFTLRNDRTRTVSNEIASDEASVTFSDGLVLCIEAKD